MEFVVQRYEWFKEVLKRMSTFERIQMREVYSSEHDNIYLGINRRHNNKTILTASFIEKTAKIEDYTFHDIFKFTVFQNYDVQHPNIYWLPNGDCRFTYSPQFKSQILLKDIVFDNSGNDVSTRAVLDYPLREEQIFQQLTIMDIPEQEYIERYVLASEEIVSELPNIDVMLFWVGNNACQINETNHEIMVQSVMDCMKELIQLETERKNGLVLKA